MKRILVIGSNGFIGRKICETLYENKLDVFESNIGHRENTSEGTSIDLFNEESYTHVLKKFKPEVVISTAWNANIDYLNSPENYTYFKAHIELFKKSYEYGVDKIVGFGTSNEYGIDNFNCHESISVCEPTNKYGYYKHRTLMQLDKISKEYNKKYIWVRPFQVYGPGEKSHRLLPSLMESLKSLSSMSISNPNRILDWIHVDDVVNAIRNLMLESEMTGIFDIGTSIGHSVQETVKEFIKISGIENDKIKFKNTAAEATGLVCADNIKLFDLGWKPKYDLQSGLRSLFNS
jgi:nucleoside-diphosphate-sugar epimerase